MNGRFYNKMPFSIPMRKVWVPGSPPMQLEAGGIIEGPIDILSQFSFLSPLTIDFSFVDSTTQNSNFEFKDDRVDEIKPISIKSIPVVKHDEVVEKVEELKQEQPKEIESVIKDIPKEEVLSYMEDDFDPKTVNWLMVKNQQLENKCKQLNIDISSLADVKPKSRKWELIKLIKQKCELPHPKG